MGIFSRWRRSGDAPVASTPDTEPAPPARAGDEIAGGDTAVDDRPPPVIDERFSADDVARYYDEWNDRYEAVFGSVYQHLKAIDHDQLLDHMVEIMGLQPGERLVDAGCGICGPARYFARAANVHIDAVTVSPVQAARARDLVAADGLLDSIDVLVGDFHDLDIVAGGQHDVVFFLEALVHAHDPQAALVAAFRSLAPGGRLYVKDFYRGRNDDPAEQRVIDECVEATNRICHLTIRNTEDMLAWVEQAGFEIEVSQPLMVPAYSIADGHEFCRRYGLDVAAGRDFTTTFYLDNLEILARRPVAPTGRGVSG